MSLNVRLDLGTIRVRKKASSASVHYVAQPYLWTVFFKIDDANDSGDPIATVVGTPGSHGNLGISNVTAPDVIRIPQSIGLWETGLNRLPNRQGTANGWVGAIIGVVAVLMEEDNVSDDGAEAGRRELVSQVQNVLDGIAANLASAIAPDADAFAAMIRSKVEDAIQAQQNVLENIWSWVDKDDFSGSLIWYRLYDDFVDDPASLPISTLWQDNFAEWELTGRADEFTESRPRFSRTALNFGSVRAGLISRRSFTITNFTPLDPLNLTFDKTGSQRFVLSRSGVELRRSNRVAVEVTFSPVGPGVEDASVVVRRRGSNGAFATISLSGSTPVGPAP